MTNPQDENEENLLSTKQYLEQILAPAIQLLKEQQPKSYNYYHQKSEEQFREFIFIAGMFYACQSIQIRKLKSNLDIPKEIEKLCIECTQMLEYKFNEADPIEPLGMG